MATIDAIVPAHNEAPRIKPVLDALSQVKKLGSLYVVADRCSDDTAEVARSAGAKVITNHCGSKGHAMEKGLERIRSERVLFCDADYVGLEAKAVDVLVADPAKGQVAGLRSYGSLDPIFRWLPPITGLRVVPTDLARSIRLDGYRAEMALNAAVGRAGLESVHYLLPGLDQGKLRPLSAVVSMLVDLAAYGLARYWDLLAYVARLRQGQPVIIIPRGIIVIPDALQSPIHQVDTLAG